MDFPWFGHHDILEREAIEYSIQSDSAAVILVLQRIPGLCPEEITSLFGEIDSEIGI